MQLPGYFNFNLGRARGVQGEMIQRFGHAPIHGRMVVPEQNRSKGSVKIEIGLAIGVLEVSALRFAKDDRRRESPGRLVTPPGIN